MKLFILFLSFYFSINAQAKPNPGNFRCWADPGFNGVIKIDVVAKKACVTGFGGQNYECDEKAQAVVNISDVQDIETIFLGESVTAKVFTVQSSNQLNEAHLTIYMKEYERPSFPQNKVFLTDLNMNTNFWPYSYKWTEAPNGKIAFGQLYCLSEKYFSN
jgi:hypothetical protein